MTELSPAATGTGLHRSQWGARVAALRPHAKRFGLLGFVGLGFILVLLLAAAAAGVVAPYDPLEIDMSRALSAPSMAHWFGTDDLGRDIFSRILFGSRVVLRVSIVAVILGAGIGAFIGLTTGYIGGVFDLVVQRLMDGLMAFPTLILAMVIVAIAGPGLQNTIIAIATVQIPSINRVVRGSVLSAREMTYVEAAEVVGCKPWRIMLRHIAPNVAAPLIIFASLGVGQAVIIVASLSFLGLGVAPPTPDWGAMLASEGRQYMIRAPWMALFPAIAISVTVLAVNVVGDSLRDVLDPRLRSR